MRKKTVAVTRQAITLPSHARPVSPAELRLVRPEPAMRWLLDFLRKDIATLREGERQDLEMDVSLFGSSGDALGILPSRRPTGLAELQADLLSGIALLLAGRPWKLPATPREWSLATDMPDWAVDASGKARLELQPLGRSYIGTRRAAFLARAADLLVLFWPQLRRCKHQECGVLLLRNRKQEYCTPEHSRAARWERFRAGRKRDYREEYVARLKRKGSLPPHRRQVARRSK